MERIHYLKRIINPLMLKVYALVLGGAGMLSLVSIKNVFINMPPLFEAESVYRFLISALRDTELPVQVILVVLFVCAALLIRDAVRNFALYPSYASRRRSR